jgi:acetyltransferase-like isoleucine patch superfamily enzyme
MKFNGRNIIIGQNVQIGQHVRIGDDTVIYDNVILHDGVTICNNCIIGEPLNAYYSDVDYKQPTTVIGKNSLIRSHSILYAGSEFGDNLSTGHRVTIREFTKIGNNTNIGTNCDIQGMCELGNNNKLQSNVIVGQMSKTGDYVFLYPYVILTNDPTPPSEEWFGVEIGDYSIITTSSVLLPGVKIGAHCLVSANSVVNGKFDDNSFISGSPAKRICDLSKAPIFNSVTGKRHYPWPNHFERGMPWQEIGYKQWLEQNI